MTGKKQVKKTSSPTQTPELIGVSGLRMITDAANMNISGSTTDNPTFIEVERKFVLNEKCYENLEKYGAKLMKKISFVDVYYDTMDHQLVLNDYWLRCRDEQWQLKCPPPERSDLDAYTLQYTEYDTIKNVLRSLKSVLMADDSTEDYVTTSHDEEHVINRAQGSSTNGATSDAATNAQFLDFLASHKCQPFARFRTERTKYDLGDDVTVDIDMADFGYSIGEIETLVALGTPTDHGVEKIKNIAHKLGVYSDQFVPGKLIVYLEKHQPSLYHTLIEKFRL